MVVTKKSRRCRAARYALYPKPISDVLQSAWRALPARAVIALMAREMAKKSGLPRGVAGFSPVNAGGRAYWTFNYPVRALGNLVEALYAAEHRGGEAAAGQGGGAPATGADGRPLRGHAASLATCSVLAIGNPLASLPPRTGWFLVVVKAPAQSLRADVLSIDRQPARPHR